MTLIFFFTWTKVSKIKSLQWPDTKILSLSFIFLGHIPVN